MSAASDLAAKLAENTETVCRHYLPAGRRCGNYWVVGDVSGSPGRSLFVRLTGRGGRVAGRWQDAATGQYGDLLDIIRESAGLYGFGATVDEARRFLSLPQPAPSNHAQLAPATAGSPEASRRLFAASQTIRTTLVETYLGFRSIDFLEGAESLRFHSRCYHRPDAGPSKPWPAMIAAVTDLAGAIQGVHRTWLAREQRADHPLLGKAAFETPRRAMGNLLGHAIRFGRVDLGGPRILLAGEGIETVLSLRCVMQGMPAAAALSAGHLSALALPADLRRLYVAREQDAESDAAFARLTERAHTAGIDVVGLTPVLKDHNDDLRLLGREVVRAGLAAQLEPEDGARFLV